MKVLERYLDKALENNDAIDEAKKGKEVTLNKGKIKWATSKAKNIGEWSDILRKDLADGNLNGVTASLGTLKSMVKLIEDGLGIKGN